MYDALRVRRAVFIDEQGVPESEEIDAYDDLFRRFNDAVHVIVYLDSQPVATGRLLLDSPTFEKAHIGRVAVLHAHRRQGLGAAVMLALQEEARSRGYPGVTLAAQLPAIPFYERLGYRARDDVFLDAGIEHRWMDVSF